MKHIQILEPWQAIAIAQEKKHVRYVREPARRNESKEKSKEVKNEN